MSLKEKQFNLKLCREFFTVFHCYVCSAWLLSRTSASVNLEGVRELSDSDQVNLFKFEASVPALAVLWVHAVVSGVLVTP